MFSVKNKSFLSSGKSPYTSSVDTWWYLLILNSLEASSNTCVPTIFVFTNMPGSSTDLSTWDSAAKFTTISNFSFLNRLNINSLSDISPFTNL